MLRPGRPLDSAMDSTVMGDDLPHDSRSNEMKDEIPQRLRRSEAERIPEPEKRTYSGRQRSQAVQDWMEKSPLVTRMEDLAGPGVGAEVPPIWPTEQPGIRTEAEVQPGLELRAAGPQTLPMDNPWADRAADDIWEELQDEIMIDTELPPSEAEPRRKPKRVDYLDHED